MKYKTILTSKGTTTIPAEIRKQLGVKPGMYITFSQVKATGEYVIKRSQTIDEIRELNKAALDQAGTTKKEYKSGDGFGKFVEQKYREQE